MPKLARPAVAAVAVEPPNLKLAINVDDLTRVAATRSANLGLPARISLEVMRWGEAKPESGAIFSCDAITAALIIDILRADDRGQGDNPTRAYLQHNGGKWIKLDNVPLVLGGVLNEDVFGLAPLEWNDDEGPTPIRFGGA